jgi:CMP-N-acetylneuraminic acid synthetase
MNICMVPVRQGSLRLARKNYLKIGEFTVLEITLIKAIQSKVFDRIVVNTDDPMLEEVTSRMDVDFYLRKEDLASSQATSDQVVLDFFDNNDGDRVFWVNTVSPLQTIGDIKNFVNIGQEVNWESGVSINPSQVHVLFGNDPLNFKWDDGFAKTQDLKPVNCFNYAMMGWHRKMTKKLADGKLFDEKTRLVESSRWSSFLLKNKDDMELITKLSKVAPNQGLKF